MKRNLSIIIILTIVMGFSTLLSFADVVSTNSTEDRALALKELGLFMGTDKGFELERTPTRTEAVVMLLRTLGKGTEATSSTYTHPFTDVPSWATKYVAYAYNKGLTSGTSKTTFGGNVAVSTEQFLTFMLRALEYSDKTGDFTVATAIRKAEFAGITTIGQYQKGQQFTRGDCANVIFGALGAKKKIESVSLAKSLVDNNVLNPIIAEKYGIYKKYQTVRVPLVTDSKNGLVLKTVDVLAAIPSAKYTDFDGYKKATLDDLYLAYPFRSHDAMIKTNKTAAELEGFTANWTPIDGYASEGSYIFYAACNANGDMVAATIFDPKKAKVDGYVDFSMVSYTYSEALSLMQGKFDNYFGAPVEYKNAIISIEKKLITGEIIKRKTGEVVLKDMVGQYVYRYVIDGTKYPELNSQAKYFWDYEVPAGITPYKYFYDESLREFFFESYFTGIPDPGNSIINYGTYNNSWAAKPEEWSKPRLVSISDENGRVIGYTSLIPSQLKVIDVATEHRVNYID